jgi:hypothetical protein
MPSSSMPTPGIAIEQATFAATPDAASSAEAAASPAASTDTANQAVVVAATNANTAVTDAALATYDYPIIDEGTLAALAGGKR